MLDALLNPYNLGWLAISAFVVLGVIAVGIGICAGLAAMWAAREKRDGRR